MELKYSIKDLRNNLVAINIKNDIKTFKYLQYMFKEHYTSKPGGAIKQVKNIEYALFAYTKEECICVSISYDERTGDNKNIIEVNYCSKESYEQDGYIIIEVEDIIWSY